VRSLLEAGADPNYVDSTGDLAGYCPLTLAAEEGHAEIVRLLLAAGARNRTFIFDAIRQRHRAVVEQWLTLSDVDVDLIDDSSWITPLIHAASGPLEIVQMLVKAGANVNAVSSEGDTALWRSAREGNLEVVRFLWPLSSEKTRRKAKLVTPP